MKKLFLTLACVWMALASFAQMNVWHNGELIFQRDYTLIDSITFGEVPVIPDTIDPVIPGETPEMPAIASPGAGYITIAIYAEVCPRGAYIAGTTNAWYANDDTYSFEPVECAPNWYALTVPYTPDFQGKVIARPSDEDVPLGWAYQWGKNYDPDSWGYCSDMPTEDNTILLAGYGEFEYENCGQPKLVNVADAEVVYIWIKNWAISPVIVPIPLQTCWAKSNWDGGYDWYWKQMSAVNDSVFELHTRFGGNGMNISETENGADSWYPLDDAAVTLIDNPEAGDSVLITFVSRKRTIGSLTIQMLEKAESTVVPAGNGTFYALITNREYADGDVCIFTGNFEENGWGDSDREMTYDPATGKWSWTGDYPENFEYKVIYNGCWACCDNVIFDGETFEASFEIQ